MTMPTHPTPAKTIAELCSLTGLHPDQHTDLVKIWTTIIHDAQRFDRLRQKLRHFHQQSKQDLQAWLYEILLLETLADAQPPNPTYPRKDPQP